MKEELFLGCMTVLIIFNLGLYFINPSMGFNMLLGTVLGLIISAIPIVLIAGIHIGALTFDFELNEVTVRFISLFSILVPLLVSINLPLAMLGTTGFIGIGIASIFQGLNVPIGLGLLTNMYDAFAVNDMWGLGVILTSIIGLLLIISVILIALEHGG